MGLEGNNIYILYRTPYFRISFCWLILKHYTLYKIWRTINAWVWKETTYGERNLNLMIKFWYWTKQTHIVLHRIHNLHRFCNIKITTIFLMVKKIWCIYMGLTSWNVLCRHYGFYSWFCRQSLCYRVFVLGLFILPLIHVAVLSVVYSVGSKRPREANQNNKEFI